MTRDEQLKGRGQFHDNTINILALWEAIDAATGTQNPNEALTKVRSDFGTWELRDLAITLYPYVESVWNAPGGNEFWDGPAYDWEFIPALLNHIDWTTAQGSPITVELPDVDTMGRLVATDLNLVWPVPEPEPIDIVGRVQRLIATDNDDQSGRIIEAYKTALPMEQKLLDDVFISLCGYSLATLMKPEDPK